MAQLASDNFTRANENPLNASNWTIPTSLFSLQIVSNRCEPTTTGTTNQELWTGRSWPNDQYSEVTIQAIEAGGDTRVVARGSTAAHTNYFVQILGVGASQSVKLWKVIAGAFTQLGTTQTVTVTAGDVFRCECQGTTIRAKQNGTQLISVTDASIASGNPGLEISAATSVSLNQASLWAGGDFSTGLIGWVNRHRKFINKR